MEIYIFGRVTNNSGIMKRNLPVSHADCEHMAISQKAGKRAGLFANILIINFSMLLFGLQAYAQNAAIILNPDDKPVFSNVPHIWHVEPGVHDFRVWKSDLYYFSQLLFI